MRPPGRASDPVFAGAGVECSVADREGGDGVRSVRCAAVDPAAFVVAVDSTAFPCPRLAGASVERPFVNGQGEGEEGVARPAAVGPARVATVVDAELEMPPVRLVRDHARIALEREVEAAALRRIVLAREVSAGPVACVEPEREAEVALAEAGRLVRGDFHDRVHRLPRQGRVGSGGGEEGKAGGESDEGCGGDGSHDKWRKRVCETYPPSASPGSGAMASAATLTGATLSILTSAPHPPAPSASASPFRGRCL